MPLCWLIGFYLTVFAGVVLMLLAVRIYRRLSAEDRAARLPGRIEMALRDLGRRGLFDEIRSTIFYSCGVRYPEKDLRVALDRLVTAGRLRWHWSGCFSCYQWNPVQVFELLEPANS